MTRIIFFGTPDYVVPVLESLHSSFKTPHDGSPITAVVTQPPRPTGRKKEITYTEIDHWAHNKNINKYYRPIDIVNKKVYADIGVLASYGAIIPREVLDHFKYGIINIHPSLLPEHRGAAPVQATIMKNCQAGVSIMRLDEKLDHGPIITTFQDSVLQNDTTQTLRHRLFERSAEILETLIPAYMAGKTRLKTQDHETATYTTQLKKAHGCINWKYIKLALEGKSSEDKWEIPFIKGYTTRYSPNSIDRFCRALFPWPGVWSEVQINEEVKRIKIIQVHLESIENGAGKTNYRLVPDHVQIEGKNPVSWKQFVEANPELI